MKNDVSVPSGKVVGIGKMKVFFTENFPHEIPTLSFVVAKTEDERYVASCIHLATDGEGASEKEAISNMEKHCRSYLDSIFSDDKIKPWDEIQELFSEPMEEYWKAYRIMQVNFAEKGISTSIQNALEEKITQLTNEIAALKEKNRQTSLKVIAYQKVAA